MTTEKVKNFYRKMSFGVKIIILPSGLFPATDRILPEKILRKNA